MSRSVPLAGQDRLLVLFGVGQVDEVRDQPFVGGHAEERDHLSAAPARIGALASAI